MMEITKYFWIGSCSECIISGIDHKNYPERLIFFLKNQKFSEKKIFHLDFFNNFGQKHCFSANTTVLLCSFKVPILLAVAKDPLNTLERLNIALDEEKQGHT